MQGGAEAAPDNNNVPAPEAAPEQPPAEQAEGPEAEGLRQRRPPAPEVPPEAAPEVVPAVVEGPSLVGVTWTFVSSFFASLIPDRPNVAA